MVGFTVQTITLGKRDHPFDVARVRGNALYASQQMRG